MPRRAVLPTAACAVLLALAACNWDGDEPIPCTTCPESQLELRFACRPCPADAPIGIVITNSGPDTLQTDMCSWRLVGMTAPFDQEEIQRPDCAVIYPAPVTIVPGASEVLEIALDAGALPDLSVYQALIVKVGLRTMVDGIPTDGEASVTGLVLELP